MRTRAIQTREEEPTIEDMKYDLAELEAMNLGTEDLIEILLYGTEPLDLIEEQEIRELWREKFPYKNEL